MLVTRNQPVRVLLIQEDAALEALVRKGFAAVVIPQVEVVCVRTLAQGLERLRTGRVSSSNATGLDSAVLDSAILDSAILDSAITDTAISAILTGLSLPDSAGVKTFDSLFAAAPNIPILVLVEQDSEALAVEAVSRGAQDYLLANYLDRYSLVRAVRNAIERKAIEDALFVERDRAQVTLDSIGDAVLCTDTRGEITYLNLAAERLTGWGREEARGKALAIVFKIVDGVTRLPAPDPLQMAVDQDRTVGLKANCILICKNGLEFDIEDSSSPIHDRAGNVIGAVIVFRDVTEVRAISNRVVHLAEHDPLTDLPNRLLLKDRMAQFIALARHHRRRLSVIFQDLDHFKHINDSLGHDIGDKLLQSVSLRLLAAVRSFDTVSRRGGDEFVILLSEVGSREDARVCAEKLLESVNAPHWLDGHEVRTNCSIGVSLYPEDGEDAETLIGHADMAMYHAKSRGRNNLQFFEATLTSLAKARQSIEDSLFHAISRSEFLLHYQPIIHLATGEIAGVEGLLRWQHPERGLLYPDAFVQIAEECGLIVEVGRWVVREACRQARRWLDEGLPAIMIAVNVSAVEFRDKHFVQGIEDALRNAQLDAHMLKLEVTEGVLMQDIEATALLLKAVKALGVQLAVDDFGTGYSSLSYLRQFPIDVLKIDRSFVHQISQRPADNAIVSAILAMGEALGYLVVAEGIETELQKEFLQSRGCAMGQGYLFRRPMLAAEISELLRSGVCL